MNFPSPASGSITHPERAIPATVSEQIQYRATLEEFIRFMADPRMEVRKITSQHAERFAQHLKKSGLAVDTHNRKIKRLCKIFSSLTEFRGGENPFRLLLFRREREEQGIGVRRLAFSREQEQKNLEGQLQSTILRNAESVSPML